MVCFKVFQDWKEPFHNNVRKWQGQKVLENADLENFWVPLGDLLMPRDATNHRHVSHLKDQKAVNSAILPPFFFHPLTVHYKSVESFAEDQLCLYLKFS